MTKLLQQKSISLEQNSGLLKETVQDHVRNLDICLQSSQKGKINLKRHSFQWGHSFLKQEEKGITGLPKL